MPRSVPVALALMLLTAAAVLAASVHVRTADGTWVELQASEQEGTVGFTVTPEQTDAGRALVVINRPAWMALEDETPPGIVGYQVAGETIEPDTVEGTLAIEGPGEGVGRREVAFIVRDDANPIDVESALVRVDGRAPSRPEVVHEDRDAHSATLAVDLNEFGPGSWRGTFEVSDLSPTSNTLTLPLSFSIAGAQIARDRQSITLSGGGVGFTVRADRRETVTVDAAGVSAFLTLQPAGQKHLYVREFGEITDRGASEGWHIVDAEFAMQDIDGTPVTHEEVGVGLSVRCAVHNDIPAILVTGTATNLADTRSMYAFWGWLPGDGFITSDGTEHEWSMKYEDVTPDRWLLLPPKQEGRPGVGWISAEDFGQSRFGTMILYTDPKRPEVGAGETLDVTFALMPATSIDEVAEVARRLVEEGALEL